MESGFNKYAYRTAISRTEHISKDSTRMVFKSINSIKDENTNFIADSFDSFKSLFYLLIATHTFTLFIFILNLLFIQLQIKFRAKFYSKLFLKFIKSNYRKGKSLFKKVFF